PRTGGRGGSTCSTGCGRWRTRSCGSPRTRRAGSGRCTSWRARRWSTRAARSSPPPGTARAWRSPTWTWRRRWRPRGGRWRTCGTGGPRRTTSWRRAREAAVSGRPIRIAAAAAHFGRDLEFDLARIAKLIEDARREGARLLVLPDAALGGYLGDLRHPDPEALPPALRPDDPLITRVARLAAARSEEH